MPLASSYFPPNSYSLADRWADADTSEKFVLIFWQGVQVLPIFAILITLVCLMFVALKSTNFFDQ